MPEQSRRYSLKGEIFADNAITSRPVSPITGSSYRNSTLPTITINGGWLFNTIVDSYDFNEVMYRITGVLKEVEEQGVLQWSDQIDYSPGAITRCPDEEVFYYCRLENGPGTAAGVRYPNNNNLAYWKPLAGSGGSPDTTSIAELRAEVANALAMAENALAKANKGGRKLFDIFYALTTDTPDGAVRLDGSVLTRTAYPEFYDAAISKGNNIAKVSSLDDWNAILDRYGECPYFYINTSAQTIKIPYMTNILQPLTSNGTLGSMTLAGLPNITGGILDRSGYASDMRGAFYVSELNEYRCRDWGRTGGFGDVSFDASRSNEIFGRSNTVQPPTDRFVLFVQVETQPSSTQFGDVTVVTPSVVSSIIISGGFSVLGNYNYFGHLMVSGAEVATQDWVAQLMPTGVLHSSGGWIAEVSSGGQIDQLQMKEGRGAIIRRQVNNSDQHYDIFDILRNLMDNDSGAILKNQSFITTVGGYTFSYSDIDGLTIIHSSGGAFQFTSGSITANGSAITQISSSFGGTSLGIEELSGGVKYVCSSALTALSIGSAAPGCNAAIYFQIASGGIITPPANIPLFGEAPTSTGVTYCLAVNGDMAVCAPAIVEAQ